VWIHIPEDIIFNIRLYCAAIEGDIVIGVKWTEVGKNIIRKGFLTFTLRQVQLEWSSQGGLYGRGM
jgi:hypothetical protein